MKINTTIALFFAGLSSFLIADPARKVVLSKSAVELSADKLYTLVEISGDKPSYPKQYDEGDFKAEMIGSNGKIIIYDKINQKSYRSVAG